MLLANKEVLLYLRHDVTPFFQEVLPTQYLDSQGLW